jgi:hypothetical protein
MPYGVLCLCQSFIHRSAWKGNSANFALTEFSEVRGILSSRCAQVTRKKLPPGHLLPQEHVGVLAGGALPGTLRIAEVDPNRSKAGETIWEDEVSDEDYSVASFRGQD